MISVPYFCVLYIYIYALPRWNNLFIRTLWIMALSAFFFKNVILLLVLLFKGQVRTDVRNPQHENEKLFWKLQI